MAQSTTIPGNGTPACLNTPARMINMIQKMESALYTRYTSHDHTYTYNIVLEYDNSVYYHVAVRTMVSKTNEGGVDIGVRAKMISFKSTADDHGSDLYNGHADTREKAVYEAMCWLSDRAIIHTS